MLTVHLTCTECQQVLLTKGATLLYTYLQRTEMFEDDSNIYSYCDSLTGESDHGFKVHRNREVFQQLVTISSNEKNHARV